jgi:hypothetical protein
MLAGPVVEGANELAPVSECRTPPAAVVDEITLSSLPSWQRATDLLLPEERLSRLRVVRKIATGGMAEVYAFVDVESGAWRVLKVASLAERNRYEDCHRNEIEALSAIDHPNILRLIDHGSERGLTELLLDQIFKGAHERLKDAVLAAQTAYANRGLFDELLSIYHLLGYSVLELR